MLGTSGIEPEAGLEPATLRYSLVLYKSHTLYRLSSDEKLVLDTLNDLSLLTYTRAELFLTETRYLKLYYSHIIWPGKSTCDSRIHFLLHPIFRRQPPSLFSTSNYSISSTFCFMDFLWTPVHNYFHLCFIKILCGNRYTVNLKTDHQVVEGWNAPAPGDEASSSAAAKA